MAVNPERTREKCQALTGAQAQLGRVEGRGTRVWGNSKEAKRMSSDLGVKSRNPARQVGGLYSLSRRVYMKVAGGGDVSWTGTKRKHTELLRE